MKNNFMRELPEKRVSGKTRLMIRVRVSKYTLTKKKLISKEWKTY